MAATTATAEVYVLHGEQERYETWLSTWIDTLDSPCTKKAYSQSVRMAFRVFCKDDPRRVRADDVSRFKASLDGRKPATIAARLCGVRAFFQWLGTNGIVDHDPTSSVKIPRVHADKPRALSFKQAKRLTSQIDTDTLTGLRDAAAMSILFGGLRIAEASALNVGDVTLREEDGQQFCRVHVRRGKCAKPRDVDLSARVYQLVQAYLDACGEHDPDAPLFMSNVTGFCKRPMRMGSDTIYRRFKFYARKAGIRVYGAHDARHSFSLWAEQGGAAVMDISRHLGHSSLATTATYLRRLAGKRNQASRHVADLL